MSGGGFVEGANLSNLLVAAPYSRNPLLADIIKRIGLAERTGRGIDRIYEGMLRYGRPEPDYGLSNPYLVNLFMANVAADREFLRMVVEQHERLGEPLVEPLIVLTRLRDERRLTTSNLSPSLQKSEAQTRIILEKLLETGLIDAHGSGRGRNYTLSAQVYRRSGQRAAYVRQAGFDALQQEQMVVKFIQAHGRIKRADVMELCHLDRNQAYRLLTRMKETSLFDSLLEEPQKPSGPVTCLGVTFENDEARRAHFTEELRKKLEDPDFRKIERFPIGSDEDILNLSDPPYYTACPNPWIADFIHL